MHLQTVNYIRTHVRAHSCTQCGHTALYFATSDGHEDVVELLLQAKADPNLTDMVTLTLTCYSKNASITNYTLRMLEYIYRSLVKKGPVSNFALNLW